MKKHSRTIMLFIVLVGILASISMDVAFMNNRMAGDIYKLNLIELLDWPLLLNSFVCSVHFGVIIGDFFFSESKQPTVRLLLWVGQTIWLSASVWSLYLFFTF